MKTIPPIFDTVCGFSYPRCLNIQSSRAVTFVQKKGAKSNFHLPPLPLLHQGCLSVNRRHLEAAPQGRQSGHHLHTHGSPGHFSGSVRRPRECLPSLFFH
ncbi:hypothetical protein AVEN_271934-1 [Araneus ventricosus]|uniref:Uncharacterized protein n=1 Tax=Araneus ventricosus TaxID=182803 RepID=A0A4Y2CBA9_ARAVE|nr:hypothetical protein AVEN_271934-1 [Araneus ventricosus]